MRYFLFLFSFVTLCFSKNAVVIIDYPNDTSRILFEFKQNKGHLKYTKVYKSATYIRMTNEETYGLYDTCSSLFKVELPLKNCMGNILKCIETDYVDTFSFNNKIVNLTILLDNDIQSFVSSSNCIKDSSKNELLRLLESHVPSEMKKIEIGFFQSSLFWDRHFITLKSHHTRLKPIKNFKSIIDADVDIKNHTEYSIRHLKPKKKNRNDLRVDKTDSIDNEMRIIEDKLKTFEDNK